MAHATVNGLCSDSGQGTPESFGQEMKKENLLLPFFNAYSCGLHDIQSTFRYPILLCIGSGGLDNNDAIQKLQKHSVSTKHKKVCGIKL